MREAEMRRQLLGQRALAAGGGAVDGDDDEAHGASNNRAEAAHQVLIFGEAGGDHGDVIHRDRLLRRQAHGEEAHGDAVIHVGGDGAAAGHLSPCRSRSGRRLRSSCGDAIGGRARPRWRPAGRFPSPAVLPAPASRCCRWRRRPRRPGWDIRRSSRARGRPAPSTPFSAEWRTIRSPISSPPLLRRLCDARYRRPSPAASRSARCGGD